MSGSEHFQGAGFVGNQIQDSTDRALRASSKQTKEEILAEIKNLEVKASSAKHASVAPLKATYVVVPLSTTASLVQHGLYNRWVGFVVLWTTGFASVTWADTAAQVPGKEIALVASTDCTAGILIIPEWRPLRPGET
jgi:hypothetical protein